MQIQGLSTPLKPRGETAAWPRDGTRRGLGPSLNCTWRFETARSGDAFQLPSECRKWCGRVFLGGYPFLSWCQRKPKGHQPDGLSSADSVSLTFLPSKGKCSSNRIPGSMLDGRVPHPPKTWRGGPGIVLCSPFEKSKSTGIHPFPGIVVPLLSCKALGYTLKSGFPRNRCFIC